MARPNKYETHVAPRFEEIQDWVRNGATDEVIAKKLGISRDSLYEYKKQFPDFSDLLKKNKEYVDLQVENALLKSALNGNITAQIFWLKNRCPEKWRDKPIEKECETNDEGIVIKIEDCSRHEEDKRSDRICPIV